MPILWPLKVPERGNAITQRKTLEIEHSCLFIHYTIWIYPFPHLLLFTSPQKIPTQIKLPKPNFHTQKKSRNRKFQTHKNPSIIPVTWNPEYPPLGKYHKNRKNKKSNKNQDFETEEAKKGPEMPSNIAKIPNVTKFQTYKDKKPRRAPKCPQISQKSQK